MNICWSQVRGIPKIIQPGNIILYIAFLCSIVIMATGGMSDGDSHDIEKMIQTIADKGDYVVLTKDEYDMMKVTSSSTPNPTLRDKVNALNMQDQSFTLPKYVQLPSQKSAIRMPSPSVNPASMEPALNVTTCNTPFLNVPKIPQFSGDEPAQKGDVTFNVWRFEVKCLELDNQVSGQMLLQAIRKSLRGTARSMLIPLGESASCKQIVEKLNGLFGNVSSNESVMQQFYTVVQAENESVTAFGCRLESLLQVAIDKGHVSIEAKDDMLRSKFWTSLRNERLKDQTRHKYDTVKTFDHLLREIRAVEVEMGTTDKVKGKVAQHHPVQIPQQTSEGIDRLSKQMATMMDKLKALEEKIVSFETRDTDKHTVSQTGGSANQVNNTQGNNYRGNGTPQRFRGGGRGFARGPRRGSLYNDRSFGNNDRNRSWPKE